MIIITDGLIAYKTRIWKLEGTACSVTYCASRACFCLILPFPPFPPLFPYLSFPSICSPSPSFLFFFHYAFLLHVFEVPPIQHPHTRLASEAGSAASLCAVFCYDSGVFFICIALGKGLGQPRLKKKASSRAPYVKHSWVKCMGGIRSNVVSLFLTLALVFCEYRTGNSLPTATSFRVCTCLISGQHVVNTVWQIIRGPSSVAS